MTASRSAGAAPSLEALIFWADVDLATAERQAQIGGASAAEAYYMRLDILASLRELAALRENCITCHSSLDTNGQGKYWCSPCASRLLREQMIAGPEPRK
jgi:hypothetical protein